MRQGFDAVYLASGFQRDAPLRIPGAEGPGVVPALGLLDRARRGDLVDLGRKAIVIGGGDTAMDAVRTAQRLTGQPATIVYRRSRLEMPAAVEELNDALEEGNLLEELASPVEVVREAGRVVGVRCLRNALGDPGPDGRRTPIAIPGSEFVIPCDSVLVAVGQRPELSFLDGSRVTRHESGGVVVDGATGCAGPEGVYAGGDVVVEPGSIISACADGRRAAEGICAHLGLSFAEPAWRRPALTEREIVEVKSVRARRLAQVKPAMLPVGQRSGMALIEPTLNEAEARIEALRCVQCTTFCDKCVEVCPNRANLSFRIEPVCWVLPVLGFREGAVTVVGSEEFRLLQDRQILHVDDFCNECDNCRTFCVHQGKPYLDKPRLFLDAGLFAAEPANAYHVEGCTVRRREVGGESRLVVGDTALVYDDGTLRARLSRDWTVMELSARQTFTGTRSVRPAAEMLVVWHGVRSCSLWQRKT